MTERLYADPNLPAPWEGDVWVPNFIGLNGYAQSGKDSTGAAITSLFGHERVAFADVLRESLYRLDPIVTLMEGKDIVRLRELIDGIGWDEAKKRFPEVRRLQQFMGTDVGRWLDENIWVNKVAKSINETHQTRFVFTDCRFPNEARWIKRKGGVVLRIDRPGISAINPHASEKALDDWPFDGYLANDGAKEDLPAKVYELIEELNG